MYYFPANRINKLLSVYLTTAIMIIAEAPCSGKKLTILINQELIIKYKCVVLPLVNYCCPELCGATS